MNDKPKSNEAGRTGGLAVAPCSARSDFKHMKNEKRYHVCAFPSIGGTPWKFNSRTLATIAAWVRILRGGMEVRIVDTLTGKHVFVF